MRARIHAVPEILSTEYFVQDSRIRENSFMISNFAKTFFLAAGNQQIKLAWMQSFASVILAQPDEPDEAPSVVSAPQPAVQRVVITARPQLAASKSKDVRPPTSPRASGKLHLSVLSGFR
jgi:hypothetical protein